MYEIIGRLALLIPLLWFTVYVWFVTVDTLSPGLFSGNTLQKTAGILLYIVVAGLWLAWFISFSMRLSDV